MTATGWVTYKMKPTIHVFPVCHIAACYIFVASADMLLNVVFTLQIPGAAWLHPGCHTGDSRRHPGRTRLRSRDDDLLSQGIGGTHHEYSPSNRQVLTKYRTDYIFCWLWTLFNMKEERSKRSILLISLVVLVLQQYKIFSTWLYSGLRIRVHYTGTDPNPHPAVGYGFWGSGDAFTESFVKSY